MRYRLHNNPKTELRMSSPTPTNRSQSSHRSNLKIRIPKNSKLASFFHKPSTALSIEGNSKRIHACSSKNIADKELPDQIDFNILRKQDLQGS